MKAPRTAILKVKTKKKDRYGVAVQILLDLGIVDTIEEAEELVKTRITFIDTNRLGLDPSDPNDFENILEIVKNHYGIPVEYSIDGEKVQLFKDRRILRSIKTAYAQGYNFDPKKFLGRKLFGEDKEDKEKLSSNQNFIPPKTSSVPQQKLIPDPWEDSYIPPEAPKPTNKLGLLTDIRESVQGILGLLETKQDALRDAAEKERIAAENAERQKEEEDLEAKGDKDTDGGALEKAAEPVKSFLEKIGSFLTKFLLAKTVFSLFEWMQKPGNRKKLDNLVEFLVDWAPVFLTGFLLFATPLVPMIKGFVIGVGFMITKMLLATAKVAGFIAAHPIAALTIAGVTGLIFAAKALGKKDKKDQVGQGNKSIDKNPNRGGRDLDDTSTIDETSSTTSEQYTEVAGERFDSKNPTENQKQAIQLKDMMTESRQGFNKGGTVPGSGNTDTVPAMLTPGEFVMSKDAVQKWGVNTLEGMNAAGGGTNIPSFGRYSGGGMVMGYGPGQIMPDQFVFNKTEFKSKSTTKTRNGEVIDHKTEDSMTDIGGSVGMPDLIEHQTQLVEEIRKVPGYENINFMDVVQYPDKQGRLVGIPEETLYPILNASDAAKATSAKKRAADIKFMQDNNLIKPDGSVKPYSYFDGKLRVDGETRDAVLADGALRNAFSGGGLVQFLNNGGEVMRTSQNATMQRGQVVSGNMNQSNAEKLMRRMELEKAANNAMDIYGYGSPEHNEVKKQIMILKGIPEEAIYTDRKGNLKVKGYSTFGSKNKRGGGFGLKRMIGGAADQLTGNLFDFDKRSGGGLLRKTVKAGARVAGGTADMLTGNLFDFDKRSGGGLLRKTVKAGSRVAGGTADMMTGNLFDFDKRSGGGLLRKTASAVGGLFGGSRDKTPRTQSSGNIRPSQDPNSLRYKQIQALRNSAEGNMNKGPITKSNLTQGSKRMKVTIPEPRVKKRGGSSSRAITLPAINQSSGASSSSLPSPKEQVPDLPISTNPTRRMNRSIMGLGG